MRTLRPATRLFLLLSGILVLACGGDQGPTGEGAPSQVELVSGNAQTGPVATALSAPLTIRVTGAGHQAVAGAMVTFTALGPGGSASPSSITSDADGLASTTWTLPSLAGPATLRVTLGGVDSLDLTASAVAGPAATLEVVQGDSQSGLVGLQLEKSIQLRAVDSYGNGSAGTVVNFVPASGHGSVSPPAVTSNSAGIVATRWRMGNLAGPMRLVASIANGEASMEVHATATVIPTPPGQTLTATDENSCAIEAGAVRCWGANRLGELGLPSAPILSPQVTFGGYTAAAITGGYASTCLLSAGDSLAYCSGLDSYLGGSNAVAHVSVAGNHKFLTISGHDFHTCGVDLAGTGWCWGLNTSGELGNGVITGQYELQPLQVLGGPYAYIGVGEAFACGLLRNGGVNCWGRNNVRQLGTTVGGDPVPTPSVAAIPATLVRLAVGAMHACGISLQGESYCWGGGSGRGAERYPLGPNLVAGNHRFVELTAGRDASCGIEASGAMWCWGINTLGAVGIGTDFSPEPVQHALGGVTEVSSGTAHTCARTNGSVYCWGDNRHGEVGIGRSALQLTPAQVAGDARFTTIATGFTHTCGVSGAGQAYCWGNNLFGQLGVGPVQVQRVLPTAVQSGLNLTGITAADTHTCGRTVGAGVACWGVTGYLGIAGDNSVSLDARTAALAGPAMAVSSNGRNSCALLADSTVACWSFGNLPAPVSTALHFSAISTGADSACGLTRGGTVACWSGNDYGTVRPVTGSFTRVSVGESHACALATDSTAFCWGDNNFGQLGTGSQANASTPTAVSSSRKFIEISAGISATCAVESGGFAWCWGLNENGQLGDGTTTSRNAPVQVSSRHFATISTGRSHSCALEPSGQAWCWGLNIDGQVGNGQSSIITQPTLVY